MRYLGLTGRQGSWPWHFLTICGAMLAVGCVSPGERAINSGFLRSVYQTPAFDLVAWHRGLGTTTGTLHVYIEGDGQAFRRGQVTRDPTPRRALGLELARRDRHRAVLYLSRPCQYLEPSALAACHPRYWSSHRFAPEVVTSMGDALDQALAAWRTPPRLLLVGYSGGGNIATLLAEERTDVIGLVTVAANLALNAWTTHHKVPRLVGSLDPAQVIGSGFGALKQRHLAGREDTVVPPAIIRRFLKETNLPPDLLEIVPGYSHNCCWIDLWPKPLCGLTPEVLC